MAGKKGEAKAWRNAKRRERRKMRKQRKQRKKMKKQAASANGATFGAHVNGLRAGGDQRRQDATHTSNTTRIKADKNDLPPKVTSSRKAKDVSDNLDSLNIRGGHHQLVGSFDSVTVNAHGAGDERNNNVLFHNDPNISRRRDQGHIQTDRQTRQLKGPDEHACPQQNLLKASSNHPELQLDDLGVLTLSLAGQTAKQICLEATFEFLQKRIPTVQRKQFWTCVMDERDFPGHRITPLPILEVPLDVGVRSRSVNLLLSTCITTLSSSFDTPDANTLKTVFNRGIVLCDTLDDIARRDALHRTLEALDWHVLVHGVNETEQYRAMKIVLTKDHDTSYPLALDGEARVAVLEERRGEERDLLRKHKETYGGFKKPLREVFVESLQNLVTMAMDKKKPPNMSRS